jgi:hypothetical protein
MLFSLARSRKQFDSKVIEGRDDNVPGYTDRVILQGVVVDELLFRVHEIPMIA